MAAERGALERHVRPLLLGHDSHPNPAGLGSILLDLPQLRAPSTIPRCACYRVLHSMILNSSVVQLLLRRATSRASGGLLGGYHRALGARYSSYRSEFAVHSVPSACHRS
jgi:hypothetical protein